MNRILLYLLLVLLAGCVGNPPRAIEVSRHDLGDPPEPLVQQAVAITRVDVQSAHWLDTTVQQYRLVFRDPLTRRNYADNRWIAAPGELLERWLDRHFLGGQVGAGGAGSGCRLVVQLDELEQRFATPQSSQIFLSVRASLYPARNDTWLGGKSFNIVQAAPTPDARGGVQATRAAAVVLTQELARWFEEITRARSLTLAACNSKEERVP